MTEEELDALISEVQKEKQIQGKDTELPTFDENQDLMLESAKEDNTNIGLIQDITQKTKKVAGELEELVVPKLQDEDFVKSVTDETVRQLGLTGRAMAEGGANLIGIVYDPIANIVNLASQMGEDQILGEPQDMIMKPEEANRKLMEITAKDTPYWDRMHPQHNFYVQEALSLREHMVG